MACDPDALKDVTLFELLDQEELAVLAAQVERKEYAPLQRIYKIGDPGGRAYVMVSGKVRLSTIDEDHQEVVRITNQILREFEKVIRADPDQWHVLDPIWPEASRP